MNHSSNKNQDSKSRSNSQSSKSRSRSRSRSSSLQKESKLANNPQERQKNNGKLYLANIPINIPQQRIKQEFEKYGKILDCKFYQKTGVPNPYYYGSITLSKKSEADLAMNNITKEYNWTVMPFNNNAKSKNNSHKERNFNNLNNNISNLNNLNKINIISNSALPQNDENNYNINGNIKVREITVGNLPLSTCKADLYKEFFIFGEISKIDDTKIIDDKKIATIKYRLINSAMKAVEKNNKMNFKGNIITINLSNSSQRKDIKGNENGYELNEGNCKLIVVVCLGKNMNVLNEEEALKIFEKFGEIKTVLIKNINNKIHIFAEYYKPEHAKMAIDELNKDMNLKQLFGEGNYEINYYFKNKLNEINPSSNELNNINTNINVNFQNNNIINNANIMNNQNIMMQKMGMTNPALLFQLIQQQNLINKQLNINNKSKLTDINQLNNINISTNNSNNLINSNHNQIPPNNINMPFPYNLRPQIFPNLQGYNLPKNNRNIPNQNQNLQLLQAFLNNPAFSNMPNNNFKNLNNQNIINNMNMNNMMPNYMNVNINNNNINNINNNNINNKNKSNEVNDILNQILSDKNSHKNNSSNSNNSDSDIASINGSHQSSEEMEFEKEYSLEGENLQIIWSGFLTKNNKDRTSVDMYKIRGNIDDSIIKEVNINVFNKVSYDEVLQKRELGLVAISPQSITQKDNFDSFITYLHEKQRCGVVNLSGNKYILYLVSPSEFSKKFYINPKKHLLGIFVDISSEQGRNPATIPPPVISLTEKRRLMSKSKKNEKKEKDNEQIKKLKDDLKKLENISGEEGIKSVEEMIKQNPELKDILNKL